MVSENLICATASLESQSATSSSTSQRGPVPKRRFQKGSFVTEANGGMYSVHYIDVARPDGTTTTKQVKRFVGNSSRLISDRIFPAKQS